jgi:hypothetical protein
VAVVVHLTAVQQAPAEQAVAVRVEQQPQLAEMPHSMVAVVVDLDIIIHLPQKLAVLVLMECLLSAMLTQYNVVQAAL